MAGDGKKGEGGVEEEETPVVPYLLSRQMRRVNSSEYKPEVRASKHSKAEILGPAEREKGRGEVRGVLPGRDPPRPSPPQHQK